MQNSIKQQPLEEAYQNQYFQTPNDDKNDNNTYVNKVQKQFTIDYTSLSYEHIQLSAGQMRQMMKNVSKTLDQKIHKYYGLMGAKVQHQETDAQIYIKKLRNQLDANKKLIESQIHQIKDIEQVDQQMASSKRMQKQAERLKQYFQTKKQMLQVQKQTRFSKGQVDKHGDYLARDLDVDKHYFKLNKIKEEDLQYAMLKDSKLIVTIQELDKKKIQVQERLQNMNVLFVEKVKEAQQKGILVEDNKNFYQEYHRKKELIKNLEQERKKFQILQYNIQNNFLNIFSEVEILRKSQKQRKSKIQTIQSSISHIQKQILSIRQKNGVDKKIQGNMSIKNIDTLLKTKKQKGDQMVRQNLSQSSDKFDIKPITNLSQSSIFTRPNFKIKPFNNSKQKINSKKNILNKSVDISPINSISKKPQFGQFESTVQKRLLKWHRAGVIKQKIDNQSKQIGLNDSKFEPNPQKQIMVQNSSKLLKKINKVQINLNQPDSLNQTKVEISLVQ